MSLRAVTLDVTHTLLDCPRLGELYAEVLQRHGVAVEEAALAPLLREVWSELACRTELGRDRFALCPEGAAGFWRRFLERVCERLGAVPPSRFAAAELYDLFSRPAAWEVAEEAPAALAALRAQGLRLGVVSNWDERLPRLLERIGLAPFFDAVVYSQAAGVEKPDPRIFRLALASLGCAAEEAVHVGDSRREDVEGAQAAGMHALLLDRAAATSGALRSLAELPARCGTVISDRGRA